MPSQEELHGPGVGGWGAGGRATLREHLAAALGERVETEGIWGFAYTLLMSTIRLTLHSQELLQKQLARGPYRSPEEVIKRALDTLA